MNKKHRLVVAAMSVLMGISAWIPGFSPAGTAFAAGANIPVNGPVIAAQKYLVMDAEANVPNVTFHYTITPGEAVPYDRDKKTSAVLSGPAGAGIGDAKFEAGQDAFETVQNLPGSSTKKDSVTLKSGQKYARSDIRIDLSKVSFTEPGVYRYKITENAQTMQAISYDETENRFLDVYVHSDENGKLSIAGTVLHKYASEVPADGTEPAEKDNGYENQYTTHNLTISKKVKGNQASHNRYFAFTVKISGATAGTIYNVDLDDAEKEVHQDGRTYGNPASVTAGENGQASVTFMLRHGQSVCLQGLADGTKYEVLEDAQDYETSLTLRTENDENDKKTSKADTTGSCVIKADTEAAFLNTREGTVPTGIGGCSAVWITLLAAGAAGAGVILFRRKRKTK